MSELINKIYFILENYGKNTEELLNCEKNLRNEYNEMTKEYRILFELIKSQVKQNEKEIIQNCEHQYIRCSEYHNDRYFICDKCGHEKY